MEKFLQLAKKHDLVLIEDCAQAIGAKYQNKNIGTFGDIACFSLYQTKNINCGEGGMILTDNDNYAKLADSILDHGLKKGDNDNIEDYNFDKLGYNYRMTEMQAAIAIEQLKKLNEVNKKRKENAQIYKDNLSDLNIIFQKEEINTKNVYFYLTGLLPKSIVELRDNFLMDVRIAGVPIKKLYPLPLNKIDLFKDSPDVSICPIAEDITKRLFNLYVNPELDKEDIDKFCEKIKKIYKKYG